MSLEGEGAEYFALSPSVVTQRGDIRLKLVQAPDYDDGTHQIKLLVGIDVIICNILTVFSRLCNVRVIIKYNLMVEVIRFTFM